MATDIHLITRIAAYFLRDSKACMGVTLMRKYVILLEKIKFQFTQIVAVILNYIIKHGLAR
jgi:hypothetical protein